MRIDEPLYWIAEEVSPRKTIDSFTMNDMISNAILTGKPFLAGKIGASELFAMRTVEFDYGRTRRKAFEQLRDCAGFFPLETEYEERFVSYMEDAISCADILVNWNERKQRYFIEKYTNDTRMCSSWLSCAFGEGQWGSALDKKRVLVIHPFEESIINQYKVFKKIHSKSERVPTFELQTVKAMQTIGGIHDNAISSWEEGLKWMENEADKRDFDVALIGCGAYGLPLGAHIKRLGKTAIHLGGDLQLMFGIIGNRWNENDSVISKINKYWIRPAQSERPIGAEKVENACYW